MTLLKITIKVVMSNFIIIVIKSLLWDSTTNRGLDDLYMSWVRACAVNQLRHGSQVIGVADECSNIYYAYMAWAMDVTAGKGWSLRRIGNVMRMPSKAGCHSVCD